MGSLGRPLDETRINSRLADALRKQKADWVWVEKGLTLKKETFQAIKSEHPEIKLIQYSEDDMFARHNQSLFYRQCLPFYDYVFTTKSYNCHENELPALGARKVVFVANSFDPKVHRPQPVDDGDRARYGADVGFIGTFEKDRFEKVLFLAESGVSVRVWGDRWQKAVGLHPNLKVENRAIYKDEFIKAICTTKINLCFLRKLNRDLHTARTFEIPACGAFMLAERTGEHAQLFQEGEEAEFFDVDDPQELLRKVKFYLKNDKRRRAVASQGRERCLKSDYSHAGRLSKMIEIIDESSLQTRKVCGSTHVH